MRPDDDVTIMADDDVIAVPLDLVLHDRGGGGGGCWVWRHSALLGDVAGRHQRQ